MKRAEKCVEEYQATNDKDRVVADPGFVDEAPEMIFRAGQSKRVWGELYKVRQIIVYYYFLQYFVLHFLCYAVCLL